tara:strand:+ start:327 stop:500 length:174 start_codon:yes stop_codon:yes gene_type:complete
MLFIRIFAPNLKQRKHMIGGFILGAIVGAAGFYLVLRNNKPLAEKIAGVVNTIDEQL